MAGSLATRCCVLLLMAWLLVSVNGQCQSALQAVTNLTNSQTAATVVYRSLNGSSRGVCGFSPTCCSSQAEQLLRQNIITQYQTTLRNNMRASFQPCMTNATRVQSADYVGLWRDELVDTISVYPQFNNPGLFDSFTNYLTNGILTLNLPSLREQVIDLFFAMYHFVFKVSVEQLGQTVPDTTAFRNCLKTNFYFVSNTREDVNQRIRTLEPRMNLLLRFLLALETSDSVLESIMDHVLSPECGDALLRLTHCKECSGTTSSSSSCTPFCQNVLRGCLVDLTEVGDVLQAFATQMDAMNNKIVNRDDPFEAIDGLTTEMFDIITAGRTAALSSMSMIETTCGVTFPPSGRRRRNVRDSHVSRRQAATPSPALTSAAQCAQNVAQFVRNLPNQLCNSLASVTGNTDCWNGDSIGSYTKALVSPDRLSQVNNSELLKVYPNTGLQYRDAIAQLKNMTAQLTSCSGSSDCDVKLVSLSVPSPSDFTLTGPRYENISRPVIIPVIPVSTTPVILPSSTIATSYHSSIFSESSAPAFESSSPTPTKLLAESSIPATTTRLMTESSLVIAMLPSSSLHVQITSEAPSLFTSLTPTPVVSSSPSLSSYTSLAIVATTSSSPSLPSYTSLAIVATSSTPTPVVSSRPRRPSFTSLAIVAATPVISSRPSTTPSSDNSISTSNLLIGAFGVGWILLVVIISLLVLITILIVVVKRRSRSTDDKLTASVQVNGNGSMSVQLSKTEEASQNIYVDQEPYITKDPPEKPAVHSSTTPRVLYTPRFSSTNPMTAV